MGSSTRLLACVWVFGLGCGEAASGRVADQAAVEAEFGRRPGAEASAGESERTPSRSSRVADDLAEDVAEDRSETRADGPVADGPVADGPVAAVPDSRGLGRSDSGDPQEGAGSRDPLDPLSNPVADEVADQVADREGSGPIADVALSPVGVDVDSLLAAAETAYERISSLRASFVQRMEIPLLDRVSEGRGMWYQRGSGHFRMEFEDPAGDILVADGTHFWAYQPSQQPNQVIKSPLGGPAAAGTVDVLGQILSEARTRYESVDMGEEVVDGVATHVVGLTPLGASRYRNVRVWIAAIDGLVRRFRIEEENESIRTVTLSALEPQVHLDDALFEFTAPPGVQIFEG